MISISIKSNIAAFERKISAFAREQVPFATAQALNALAENIQQAEIRNMDKVLDKPTPFTKGSIRIRKANKNKLVAVVYMMDKAAEYLEPYEFGGLNKLNSKALLKPVDQAVNAYGNLPRNLLERLKNRPDIFIGKVKTKNGEIDGVWQRSTPMKVLRNGKQKAIKGANHAGKLRLLIKFSDAHAVKQKLNYHALAQNVASRLFDGLMRQALASAARTAR